MNEKYIIGIDAGGTKIAYGLFDSEGKIIDKTTHPTNTDVDGFEFSDTLTKNINEILEKNNLTFEQLDGIGIGIPSFINRETGYIYMTSAIPRIKDFQMREYIQAQLPTRIVLDNDANAAALAEFRHGAGRGTRHMIYMVVGTGLGCGIIINNEVFSGSYGAAGECGHMLATPNEGLMCGCENKGCFMSYVAGKHLPERVKQKLKNSKNSSTKSSEKSILITETANGETLLNAYKKNDPLAKKMIDEMAHYLALCVFNVYQMLNIDTYIFGGGLTAMGDVLFNKMREEFDKLYHIPFPVHFKMAQLKENIGIIGAAEMIRDNIHAP
ncbi:MAG: ROK family protein [Oscillospiraceae bacterium]|nr:ROK family protein [Oscillospiraceae bacterium]